jgi:hypothetical protein
LASDVATQQRGGVSFVNGRLLFLIYKSDRRGIGSTVKNGMR